MSNANPFPYGDPFMGLQTALLRLHRPGMDEAQAAAWQIACAAAVEVDAVHRRAREVIHALEGVEYAKAELQDWIEAGQHLGITFPRAGDAVDAGLCEALRRAEGELEAAFRQYRFPHAAPLASGPAAGPEFESDEVPF